MVKTDRMPLIPLINTCYLNRVPLGCLRLLMQMMAYNTNATFVICKISSSPMHALSRAHATIDEPATLAAKINIHAVATIQVVILASKALDIVADQVMRHTLHKVWTGWSDSRTTLMLTSFRTVMSVTCSPATRRSYCTALTMLLRCHSVLPCWPSCTKAIKVQQNENPKCAMPSGDLVNRRILTNTLLHARPTANISSTTVSYCILHSVLT